MVTRRDKLGPIAKKAFEWRDLFAGYGGRKPCDLPDLSVFLAFLPENWHPYFKKEIAEILKRVWFLPESNFLRCISWLDEVEHVVLEDIDLFKQHCEWVLKEVVEYPWWMKILEQNGLVKPRISTGGQYIWLGSNQQMIHDVWIAISTPLMDFATFCDWFCKKDGKPYNAKEILRRANDREKNNLRRHLSNEIKKALLKGDLP
jgi:hypothetical protein